MARTREQAARHFPHATPGPAPQGSGGPRSVSFHGLSPIVGSADPLYDVLLASGQNVPPLPPVPSLGRVVGRAWGSGLTAGRSLCLEHTPGYSLNSWIQSLKRLSSVTGIKVRFPGSVDRPWGLLAALCPTTLPCTSSGSSLIALAMTSLIRCTDIYQVPAVCQALL